MSPEDREDAVQDSLLNAQVRTGGMPGIASETVLALMAARGLLGPGGGLTRKGAAEAHRVQQEAGWL